MTSHCVAGLSDMQTRLEPGVRTRLLNLPEHYQRASRQPFRQPNLVMERILNTLMLPVLAAAFIGPAFVAPAAEAPKSDGKKAE